MSVRIDFDVAGGMARRQLVIERVETGYHADGSESGINQHKVTAYGVAPRHRPDRIWFRAEATFEHHYEDDVLALVSEAVAALRTAGLDRV